MLRIDSAGESRIKKIGNIAVCAVFICCLFVLSLFFFIVEKKTHSDIENRDLAQFPVLWDGKTVNSDFYSELDSYYSDAFPFRDRFLSFNRQIQTLYTALKFPGEDDDVVFIATAGGAVENNGGSIGALDFDADVFWADGFTRSDSGNSAAKPTVGDGAAAQDDGGGPVGGGASYNGGVGVGVSGVTGSDKNKDNVSSVTETTTLKYGQNNAAPASGDTSGAETTSGAALTYESVAGVTAFANVATGEGDTSPAIETRTTAGDGVSSAPDTRSDAGDMTAPTDTQTPDAYATSPATGVGAGAPSPAQRSERESGSRETEYEANESTGISIVSGQAFEVFIFSESRTIAFAEAVDAIAESCGVPAYVVIPPSASEFYLPAKYRSMQNEQKPAFNLLAATLKTAVLVDTYAAFEAEKDNYIYFRTDHHWTADGAYIAYREFAKTAGFTPVFRFVMKQGRLDGFLGSLYRQIYADRSSALLEQEPDFVQYYEPMYETEVINFKDADMKEGIKGAVLDPEGELGSNLYNVFFGGDMRLLYMHSDVANGRSIIVVRDSYGHAFIPFLANNYEHVYAVEPRYFESFPLAQFIADHNIDELLFVNHSLLATSRYWMNWITELEKLY